MCKPTHHHLKKRFLKTFLVVVVGFMGAIIVLLLWLMRPYAEKEGMTDLYSADCLIAHAGGKTFDGKTYTNSKEALLYSINLGYKNIELDLYLTTDSQLVCLHKLDDFNRMTGRSLREIDYQTFMNEKYYNKYTPISLSEAVEIWKRRPFVFVTDKFSEVDILDRYFVSNRQNVYVEVRRFWNYHRVSEHEYHAMLTIPHGILGFIKYFCGMAYGGKIYHIVTSKNNSPALLRLYQRLGSRISVFTVNDQDSVKSLISKKIDMIYTDDCVPADF